MNIQREQGFINTENRISDNSRKTLHIIEGNPITYLRQGAYGCCCYCGVI